MQKDFLIFGESESARSKWSKAIHVARANKNTTNTTTKTPKKVVPGAADDIF